MGGWVGGWTVSFLLPACLLPFPTLQSLCTFGCVASSYSFIHPPIHSPRPPTPVSDYMRKWRNNQREHRALHKFTEVAWKLLIHLAVTSYGVLYILLQQPYVKDMTLCWSSYPFSPLPPALYWYYMFEFGTFLLLLLLLLFSPICKDNLLLYLPILFIEPTYPPTHLSRDLCPRTNLPLPRSQTLRFLGDAHPPHRHPLPNHWLLRL